MARLNFDIAPITINGRTIRQVIVDTHVRKHKDITDDVIMDLVRQLDHSELLPDDVKGPYQYFSSLLYLRKSSIALFGFSNRRKYTSA